METTVGQIDRYSLHVPAPLYLTDFLFTCNAGNIFLRRIQNFMCRWEWVISRSEISSELRLISNWLYPGAQNRISDENKWEIEQKVVTKRNIFVLHWTGVREVAKRNNSPQSITRVAYAHLYVIWDVFRLLFFWAREVGTNKWITAPRRD